MNGLKRKQVVMAAIVLTMSGCTSTDEGILRPLGPQGYVATVSSAIYANDSKKGYSGGDVYFGDHVVRGRGGDQGDYRKRPQGAVIAYWSASEDSGEKEYKKQFKQWFPVRTNKRFYYATALPSQLIPYPPKAKGHQYYGIYVSAGRTVVSDQGLRAEDAPQATGFTVGRVKLKRYVFGREDTVYYKILSRGPGNESVEDDPSPWHTLPGVALTEAQYMELASCSPDTLTHAGNGKPCRAFLSIDDPDLTPEQREYVRKNPITRDDIKPLIRRLEQSSRNLRRWQ